MSDREHADRRETASFTLKEASIVSTTDIPNPIRYLVGFSFVIFPQY